MTEKKLSYNAFTDNIDFAAISEAERLVKKYLIGEVRHNTMKTLLGVREGIRAIIDYDQILKQTMRHIADFCSPLESDSPDGLQYRLENVAKAVAYGLGLSLEEVLEETKTKVRDGLMIDKTIKDQQVEIKRLSGVISNLYEAIEEHNARIEGLVNEVKGYSYQNTNLIEEMGRREVTFNDLLHANGYQEKMIVDLRESVEVLAKIKDERRERITALEEMLEETVGDGFKSVCRLREELGNIQDRAKNHLKRSYDWQSASYSKLPAELETEIAMLRGVLASIGIKAGEALEFKFVPADPPKTCRECGNEYGGHYSPCPHIMGVDSKTRRPEDQIKKVSTVADWLGAPVIEGQGIPKDKMTATDGKTYKVLDFSKVDGLSESMQDARLNALKVEAERQARIDQNVKELIRGRGKINITVQVNPESFKLFDSIRGELASILDEAQDRADAIIDKAISGDYEKPPAMLIDCPGCGVKPGKTHIGDCEYLPKYHKL